MRRREAETERGLTCGLATYGRQPLKGSEKARQITWPRRQIQRQTLDYSLEGFSS